MRFTAALLISVLHASQPHAYSGDAYEVCRHNPDGDNFLALRSGPSSSHAMVMKLGPGPVVEARGDEHGNWLEVFVEMANGKTYFLDLPSGFAYTKYLCPL